MKTYVRTSTGFTALESALIVGLIIAAGAAIYFANQAKVLKTTSAKSSVSPSATASALSSPKATKSQAPSGQPSTGGTALCTASNLSASLTGNGGAAGTTYYTLVLKNTGSGACSEYGYPGVSLVNGKGEQLGAAAARNPASTPQAFSLQPGKTAFARLGFPNPGNFPAGQCSEAATNLKIFPPGQTNALLTPVHLQACPGFSVTALAATP